jgi:3-hydroxyisobutyrate dehydrogenase-like beta-hydroxyacid dehydrogenase
MSKIGFVGLGDMGSRMVQRLMAAGHSVIGYSRTASKAQLLIAQGMQWAETPCEIAQVADIILSSITNDEAFSQITEGPKGILAGISDGKIYADMSTISVRAIREMSRRVSDKGAQMLDAPVSGSKLTLDQGKLLIMVGGDRSAFERVKPIFEAIGPKVIWVGESGQAMVLKLAVNLSVMVQFQAFSESLLLAEKSGIPRKTAVEVLLNSAAASPSLIYRGPFVLEMPEPAWFNVTMMQKDMNLAQELAQQLEVPIPTGAITNQVLTMAKGLGLAEQDFAIVYEMQTRLAALKSPEEAI